MADYSPNQFEREPQVLPELVVARWETYDLWSALYVNGKLDRVGDHRLVDERVVQLAKVEYVEADFLLGGNTESDAAKTLKELKEHHTKTVVARAQAQRLRDRAQELLAEADRLERG